MVIFNSKFTIFVYFVVIFCHMYHQFAQNVVFDDQIKRTRLPGRGRGGYMIRALPESKRSFSIDIFPNTWNMFCALHVYPDILIFWVLLPFFVGLTSRLQIWHSVNVAFSYNFCQSLLLCWGVKADRSIPVTRVSKMVRVGGQINQE